MSPLLLPQTIALERGEALQLYLAVATVWREAMAAPHQQPPQPLALGLLLALPVLQRLGKRLYRVGQAEAGRVGKPSARPRAFRLSGEEVAVLTSHVLPGAGLLARPVLGKVQQKSLNLTPFVIF